MNYIEYMQNPAGVVTSKSSQDKTAKQILKDGEVFLSIFL